VLAFTSPSPAIKEELGNDALQLNTQRCRLIQTPSLTISQIQA